MSRIWEPPSELDPDGDILLVVTNPSSTRKRNRSDPRNDGGNAQSASNLTTLINEYQIVEPPVEGGAGACSGVAKNLAIRGSSPIPEAGQDSCARFQVSSRHLALASPIFNHMVDSELLTRSQQLQCTGLTEIPLQGDDPDALLILLDLIHGRFKKVPRKISLETLTWIAFLADKYELWEITELSKDCWLSAIRENVLAELSDDLLCWMFIAEVFQEKSIFSKLSRVAKMESKGPLLTRDLPIPGQVLVRIQSNRLTILSEIFSYIGETQERLLCKRTCPHSIECDEMALGCLLRGLEELKIFPPPESPYENVSIKEVFGGLRNLRVPQYCKIKKKQRNRRSEGNVCEGVERPLIAKIDELQHQLEQGVSD